MRPAAGFSGTTAKSSAAVARQMPASQKNRPCQLIIESDHWTGHVAAIEPAPPAIMWKPVTSPHCRGGYHRVKTLIADISPPAKPMPISTRATTSSGERGAEPEQRRAERRHDQQHGLHLARPVAVERHALQRLDEGEEQEEGRGQQPEIGGGDADVALEIREDDRVDAAEDVRKEIGESERQEDLQQQLQVWSGRFRSCLFWRDCAAGNIFYSPIGVKAT